MVKTFHNTPKTGEDPSPVSQEKRVKVFTDTVRKTAGQTEQRSSSDAPDNHPPRSPAVLFANQVHAIKSDTIAVSDAWKSLVDEAITDSAPEFTVTKGDYLLIKNTHDAIHFFDAAYQMEFGSEFSQRFQAIQGFMSDYVKEGNVTDLVALGNTIIDIAKSIDIDIFNPNKMTTKLSKLLGNRRQKVIKIRKEFDYACDQIDARLDRALGDLTSMRSSLTQFQKIAHDINELKHSLQLSLIALHIRITHIGTHHDTSHGIFQATDERDREISIERWRRKLTTLRSLYQSVMLTLPQVNLYKSNLLGGFEKIEEIKIHLIQVWKQQFLTVIAVDESSDTSLFYDLNDAQQGLVNGIKELNSHGL